MAKRTYSRSGTVQWLDDEGRRHRADGPASVWPDGTQWWYHHDLYHFAYGPADLYAEGRLVWYQDRQFLRMRYPYG